MIAKRGHAAVTQSSPSPEGWRRQRRDTQSSILVIAAKVDEARVGSTAVIATRRQDCVRVRQMSRWKTGLWAAAFLIAVVVTVPARAAEVDLALVLAVDVSSSVDETRYRMQMQGYATAFRDPMVVASIKGGPRGAIAVTLVQWAGYKEYHQTIDWVVVDDGETADRFARAIAETRRPPGGSTSISSAIDFSAEVLQSAPYRAARLIIDLSADGSNNNGRSAAAARDEAVAAGITVNGLAITAHEPMLDAYFREEVVGGPGAFVVVADDFEDFAAAILRKLVVEIADAFPPQRPAMKTAPKASRTSGDALTWHGMRED